MREKIVNDEENYSNEGDSSDSRSGLIESENRDNISIEIDVNDSTDVMSETTESEVLSALVEQSEYYENLDAEITKKDTEKTLQSYLKKIFRQVKFLTESGKNYREPNFVQHVHGQKSQSAELCEYLWKKLGKTPHSNYIM